jgi:hypothetical protein
MQSMGGVMIDELWNLLAEFTPDAHQAAITKCAELEFDQDAGVVSLNESYINLIWCSNTLRDAIEKNKLIPLPIMIQKEMLEAAKTILANHNKLLEGTDVIAILVEAIEKLFTDIWRYGLSHLVDEVLGYQTKINQLKDIERSVIQTKVTIDEGLATKQSLDKLLIEVGQYSVEIQAKLEVATTAAGLAENAATKMEEEGRQATETLKAINQDKATSADDLAAIQVSQKEAKSDEEAIREMVAEFNKMTEELAANKKSQKEMFDEFDNYRNKIDGLLGDANRTGMAASFTNRRLWLIAPIVGWLAVFGFSIFGLWYIGDEHIAPILKTNSAILWEQLPLRLALTAPLIWLGWFSARQYGFTSRLREDYAYKEASSKSFEGYKREAKEVEPEMLKKLLEQAIQNLGDNPIRIYEGKNNHSSPTHELFDNLMKDDKAFGRFKEFFSIFKS